MLEDEECPCNGDGYVDAEDNDGYATMHFCECPIGEAAHKKHLDDLGIPKWARAS
jgi:hypothetical protein